MYYVLPVTVVVCSTVVVDLLVLDIIL
jgi:hypothetical protein